MRIGGSDADISAALRARELDPTADVTVVLADAYPNFSICGIPYYVSGEVGDWHNLAHRTAADPRDTGMTLRLDTVARRIDPDAHRVHVVTSDGSEEPIHYDALIIGTGAVPIRPPIAGLDHLGPGDGVHLLHTMGDAFALMRTFQNRQVRRAVIVGAGYVGLEMAEALTSCGLGRQRPMQHARERDREDPPLGSPHPLEVQTTGPDERPLQLPADVVLVSVGVRPDSELAAAAGAELGVSGAIAVDLRMRTNLPDVLAAGDCVTTYHRLLGATYLPLGTTAHKQGRIAGENALGAEPASSPAA